MHLAVASGISVFVAETTVDLHGGVALLGGSVVVIDQNLIMIAWKGRLPSPTILNLGLDWPRMRQEMPDRVVRELEITGDLADGLAISTRPANGAIIVHRKHFFYLRASE